jgi:hypothetical protein
VYYTYNGAKFNLNALYKEVRNKRGKAKILASVVVIIGIDAHDQEVQARIVFVRDRNRSKQWLAVLCTDLKLTEEEIVRIYGKRWDIEVFFKMNKSYLRLAKEFQGRSYDMMVSHTCLVLARYLFLAMETRDNKDQRTLGHLFYVCYDKFEDIELATALSLLIDLLKQALHDVLLLTEQQFQEIFDKFTSGLPKFYKGLLGISG